MNEIEKSRIRLSHWIDHNIDHLKGYHEVAAALQEAGETTAADVIRRGVESVEEANRQFQQALALLSDGEPTGVSPLPGHAKEAEKHAHEHAHEHEHEHEHHHAHHHTHEHSHGHSHEEEHPHEDEHHHSHHAPKHGS